MATPTFTKKEVDIEALMAQAAALEAEAAAGKDKGKKEKPPKVKKEKEKKEKPPRVKKEKAPKEAKPKTPKKDKPAKESKPAKERKEKKTDKKKSKKNALTTRKVFGVPVNELEVEESEMPEIYMTLISALESYATETQGLFRIAAAKAEVDALVARFEGGEDIDWANYEDKHLVGGVLMEFLLRMPEPLITYEVYHKLISEYKNEPDLEKKYQKVRAMLKQLPELNFNMLEHLMDFLDTMTRDADDNLMTAANLAICFGPGLMRRLEDDITLILKDTPFINEIITSLIEQYGFYFRGEEIDKSHNTAAGVAAGSTTTSSPALNKQASGADYSAFVGVALNGLTALSKELTGIISDLGWGKLWKPLGLAHLFVLEDFFKKLIGDEIVKLSVDDIQNEIEDSLESYMDEVENKGTEDACAFLKAAMQKHQAYISDTIVVLANQQAERELVLSSCRLSNNGKLLLEHLQPNIKRDMAVSVSDISQVQETVPKILKLMNELKVGMNTCTDYSAAVLISRVVRGVQKALKDKSKAPIAEVDLNLPPSDPSPKDKAKIQSLQDALEFSFPACDKVLSSILDATKDPEKKSEAIRDADLLMELFGLLEKVSQILKKQSAAPPPIAPHPAVKTNTPPPISPHPASGGGAPPPVAPHPRAAADTTPASPGTRGAPPPKPAAKAPSGGIKVTPPPVAAHPRGTPGAKPPAPIAPHPASGGGAPPPVAPHPRAGGAVPPPVAPHPKNTNAPPPVAPHPRAAAPPPVAPHPRTLPK